MSIIAVIVIKFYIKKKKVKEIISIIFELFGVVRTTNWKSYFVWFEDDAPPLL